MLKKLNKLNKIIKDLDLLDKNLPKSIVNNVPKFFNLRWCLHKHLLKDDIFFYAKFTAIGILCKSDAILNKEEVAVIKNYINNTVFMDSKRNQAFCLVLTANKHKDKYSKLIKRMLNYSKNREKEIILFFDNLVEMALIDGNFKVAEDRLLSYTIQQFSFLLDTSLRNEVLTTNDKLGIKDSMSSDEMKKICKHKIRLFHTDNINSYEIDHFLSEYCLMKFTEIKQAYDEVKVLKKL